MEWSRPRKTPMAGRRKATESYCNDCQRFHRTARHIAGAEVCPYNIEKDIIDFPYLRLMPRTASK